MIMGGGGHVTLSAGIDGMLLVDTGSAAMAEQMLAKIKEIGTMVAAAPTRLTTCVGPNCYPAGNVGVVHAVGLRESLLQRHRRVAGAAEAAALDYSDPLRPRSRRWHARACGGGELLRRRQPDDDPRAGGCRGRRHAHRAGKRAAEDDGNELSGKRVGAGNVLHADLQDEPVHQRRRDCGVPRARGHHRWRQLRPFPLFRCDQRRRSVHVRPVSR